MARTFAEWQKLFALQCDTIDDFPSYYSSVRKCADRLREDNSVAIEDDTFIRALGNKFFTGLVRFRFGCDITDSLFFYPMFNRRILNSVSLNSDDFTLCLELPVKVHQQKLRYTEILSEERERYAGKTKVNALIDGLKILIGIFSIKKL